MEGVVHVCRTLMEVTSLQVKKKSCGFYICLTEIMKDCTNCCFSIWVCGTDVRDGQTFYRQEIIIGFFHSFLLCLGNFFNDPDTFIYSSIFKCVLVFIFKILILCALVIFDTIYFLLKSNHFTFYKRHINQTWMSLFIQHSCYVFLTF